MGIDNIVANFDNKHIFISNIKRSCTIQAENVKYNIRSLIQV